MTLPADNRIGLAWWPLRLVRAARHHRRLRRIALLWLGAGLLAVITALVEARENWSAILVPLGGVHVSVSVYPPLFITLLLTLWLGPEWGVVPAYLATLASARTAGMGWGISSLFALATPVELVIVWAAMVVLRIHPDLERRRDVVKFAGAALIAATASSLAGLIWIDVHGLDVVHGRYIWQGWLVGDLIQMVVLTPPLLHVAGARVRRWVDRQFPVPPRHTVRYGKTVGIVVGIVLVVSALALQGTRMAIASLGIPPSGVTASGEPLLPHLREIGWFLALLLAVVIVTISMLAAALARIGERERHVALRDQLTGSFNRRAFYDLYQKEADRSRRLGRGISLIQLDIDHFKRVNDRFGHEAGDEVLRQLVRRTQTVMREHDLLFRWGGEEFLVLLPHTGPDDAAQLAERIRAVVAAEPFGRYDGTPPIPLTVSLGAVGASAPPEPDELIGLADVACYLAKEQGRNRVVSDMRDVELDGRLLG